MTSPNSTIPVGLCQCGCGQRTALAPQNHRAKGLVKGQPRKWVHGHNSQRSHSDYAVEDRGYTTPCWIWRRGIHHGYGILASGIRAHRAYYEARYGPIPGGLELDHLCRVKTCVNPDHLEAVTHAENVRRGPNVKLTMDDARAIRRAYATGKRTQTALADEYGVHHTQIYLIVHGKKWRE